MDNINYRNENFNKNTKILIIETNKEYYFKGEIIEGNIILNCISNLTLNEISIALYSKENWIIQETSTIKYGEKNNQLLSKFDIGLNKILNNNKDINVLVPGRYIFPFQIQLPNYLQPSFEYPIPNRAAYLRYLLESEIISNDIKTKSNIYILIKGSIILLRTPKIFSSVTNVHKWGMFDGGSTILKVSYKKNNFTIDEMIPLNIDIDNTRGKLKVKESKIRIIRTIQFSKPDKSSIEKYPLEKTIYSKVFWSEVFPNSKRSFLFQTEIIDKDLIDFNFFGENNPYPKIKDINILLPSIEGRIIKCDYRIQVSLYFDSFVTSGYRPRVCLPISIIHQFQEEDNNLSNIQNENSLNVNINTTNYYNNNSFTDSSMLYDKNYENKKQIENNSINNNFSCQMTDLSKFNCMTNKNENERNNIKEISNLNINKKPNYIELNEETNYYNINEI